MNKKLKQVLSIALCLALLLTAADFSGFFDNKIMGNQDIADNADKNGNEDELAELEKEAGIMQSEDILDEDNLYSTKRLIVLADKKIDTAGASSVVAYDDMYILQYDSEKDTKAAYEKLTKDKNVKSVEIDAVMEIESKKITDKDIEKALKISSYSDNDKKTEEVLDNYDPVNPNGYDEKSVNNVDIFLKKNKYSQKRDVIVAIIDSGLDKSAVSEKRVIDSEKNYSTSGAENDIADDNGHGTSMAEIITNQTGDNVKIMPVKTVNADGKCSILSAYLGIKYAMEKKADIINISLNTVASTKSAILEDVIKEADKKGIKVVVSAGNNADDVKYYTPSNIKEAFVISATDENGTLAGYSNFGETIDYASCGLYQDEEGTSIAAANFSAGIAALKGAGVKDIETTLDEITNFTEESEKSLFLGKGYIGYERHIIVKSKKTVVTGVAARPADIRNLKDGVWKELSDNEFDEYVKNSDYIHVGAFLSTLDKKELKEAVSKSENLRMEQFTYSGKKLLRKNRKYEEALFCYSRIVDTLTTSELIPDFLTGTMPVWIGGKNKENNTTSYCELSKVTISGYDMTSSALTITEASFGNPQNNCGQITLSGFGLNSQSRSETWMTDSVGEQIYFALWGQFTSTVPNYYQTTADDVEKSYNVYGERYDDDGNTIERNTVYRMNFGTYNGATAANGWNGGTTIVRGADTNNRTMTHSFQLNLLHCGITYGSSSGNYETYHSGTIGQLYFLIERPVKTLTPVAGEGVTGIQPAYLQCKMGETLNTSSFVISVSPGYESATPSADYVMTSDMTVTINATPKTYYINYYANHNKVHRTDNLTDATEPDSRQAVLYNRGFTYKSAIFTGYFILSYEDFASDLDYYDNQGSRKKFLQTSLNEENPDELLTKNINAKVNQWKEGNDLYNVGADGGTYTWLNDRSLYGQWKADDYGTLPEPARTGFDFKGWYTSYGFDNIVRGNSGKGTKITASTAYTKNADSTIYAKWERHKWTVTYDYGTNGGYKKGSTATKTETKECYYDYIVDTSPIGEKNGDTGIYDDENNPDGWQFVGWSTNPNATEPIESYYLPDNDVTLYAIYKKNVTLTLVDANGDDTVTTNYKEKTVYNKGTNTTFMLDEGNKNCTFNDTHGVWELYGWSTQKTAAPSTVYNKNAGFSINKDTTIYGLYQRTMQNIFVSMNGISPNSQHKNGNQKLNSYVSNGKFTVTSLTITTPASYIYTGNAVNGAWSFVAWTHNPREEVPTLINQNTSITVTEGKTYYAKYRRDLVINYTDYNGTQKRNYSTKHEQTTFADKINDYNNPDVTIAAIGDNTGWKDKMYWANTPSSLNSFYSQNEKITLTDNTDLYAVYQRQLTVTYKDYKAGTAETRESDKKNQRANAADIDGTKQSITFTSMDIRGYIDSDNVSWGGVYWSKDTASTAPSFVSATRNFQIKDDTTLYAVYETTYENKFISRQNASLYTTTIQTPTRTNAYNVANPAYKTLTVPALQNCNYNNISWNPVGWSENTQAEAEIALSVGETYTVKSSKSFYGIYSTGTKVKFVDYQGSIKRQRQIDATSKLNSFSLSISDLEVTTPEMGVYTKEGNWGTVGWTTSIDAKPDTTLNVNETVTVNSDTVFYGVYKKHVTMTLVDFNSATSSMARTRYLYEYAYVNSNDVSNEEPAVFSLPEQGKYTVNNKDWDSIGWDESTTASTIAGYYAGSEISSIKDKTLYGLYSYDVTVTYDGNGGTSYSEPSIGIKTANAAGDSTAANITISSSVPVRTGYTFMNKWAESTKDVSSSGYEIGKSYQFNTDTTLYAQWGIDTIDKKVTVEWEDADNANNTRPDYVYLTLYRDGEGTNQYIVSKIDDTVIYPVANTIIDTKGQAVKVEKTGNFTEYTFAGLQKYNMNTGMEYKYTVKEEPVESLINGLMYTISYPSDGVIRNTLVNTDGVKMNVAIRWDDGLNAWHIRPSSVNISLIQTDPDSKEEKTIKVANIKSEATKESQMYTFNNVPLMNGNQKLYEYKVKQDWIAGYSTTYGVSEVIDGINTFPVYNTSSGLPTLYGENYIIFSADAFSSDTGNLATGKDYLNVDINEDEPILITLRQIHKNWSGTGIGASESYDNNRYMHNDVNGTDVSYNVIVSPRVDTRLVKIPFGRYELDVHNHALFDFENFTAANYEKVNADLDTINGKQYVTFSARYSSGAIAKLHANFLIANWRGYTSMKRMYQPLDYSVVQVRMPGIYDNLGNQVKTWNLMKIDGDMNLNGTIFSLASKTHVDGELIIDNEVETIAVDGLANQANMIKLTLPNNLKKVNGNAFMNCSRLRIVTYQGVQYVSNDALKEAFRRNGVTFADSAFTGVALGY